MASLEDEINFFAAKLSDFDGNGERMKEVDLGEIGKCLLIRHNDGEITAIGSKCTHYGAPLVKGALANGRIRCPWHGACFSAKTGDIEDFPGLDSLQCFKVKLENDNIVVNATRTQLNQTKRNDALKACHASRSFATTVPDKTVDHCVVIIGGGPSSLTCAETLRKEGFLGRIIILCKDSHPPYDRPKLSKALAISPEKAYLRTKEYLTEISIEFYNNTEVVAVDVLTKNVRLSKPHPQATTNGGMNVKYDSLVIATGGEPRTLKPTPGWNLGNVFVLRTLADANAIAKASQEKRVVIVGSSFIGMEVASFLAEKNTASSISVVCGKRSSVPFEASLGKDIGKEIMKMHQEKGVKFHPKVGIESLSCECTDGVVSQVNLSDGTTISADVVVVGIGVAPATSFLQDSEIRRTKGDFIVVDGQMRTKVPHVYAVGDIALFPLHMRAGALTNIQHWQMAHMHGNIAARAIAQTIRRTNGENFSVETPSGGQQHVLSVPFFWTVQFGESLRYAGYGAGYDDVVIQGSLEERKFVAYYLLQNVIVAVATMKMDPIASEFAEKLSAGQVLTRSDIPR